MQFHFTSQDRPRKLAKALRTATLDAGRPMRLSQCQAVVARMFGYCDWFDLEKAIPAPTRSLDDALCSAEVVEARRGQHVAALVAEGFDPDLASTIVDFIHPTNFVRPGEPAVHEAMLPVSPVRPHTVGFTTAAGREWFVHDPVAAEPGRRCEVVFGPAGSGRSTFAARLSYAFHRSGRRDLRTRVATIGSGRAGDGVADMARWTVEDPDRQVRRIDMTNSARWFDTVVNVMDLSPGQRLPAESDISFIQDFVRLVVGRLRGTDKRELDYAIRLGLEATYRRFSDDDGGTPRPYSPGVESDVDRTLERIDFVVTPETSWLSVVDALLSSGCGAGIVTRAQRNASPTLNDLVQSMSDMQRLVGGHVLTSLFDAARAVGHRIATKLARDLQVFQFIGSRSNVEIADADVVSILVGGSPRHGSTGTLQAIAHMLACRLVYRDFDVEHRSRVKSEVETICRLVIDDWALVGSNEHVDSRTMWDMRIAWRSGMGITLVTDDDRLPWDVFSKCGSVWRVQELDFPGMEGETIPIPSSDPIIERPLFASPLNLDRPDVGGGPLKLEAWPASEVLWAFMDDWSDAALRDALLRVPRSNPRAVLDFLSARFPKGSAYEEMRLQPSWPPDGEGSEHLPDDPKGRARAVETLAEALMSDFLALLQDQMDHETVHGAFTDGNGRSDPVVCWPGRWHNRPLRSEVAGGRYWWMPSDRMVEARTIEPSASPVGT